MSYNSYENIRGENAEFSEPPLIIMHGLFGSKSNWNSLSKAIHNRSKKKIVTVDARNHGESPHTDEFSYEHLSSDIHLLLGELGVSKAHLLGHSMGGRAVMTFALTYPELVESLIVVDISPINSSPNLIKMSTYFDALKSVRLENDLPMSEARRAADKQLKQTISDLAIRQFLLTNLIQTEGGEFKWRVNLDSLHKQFDNELMRFPDFVSTCRKPTLFIGGLKSDYLRFEEHRPIQRLFPLARFMYLDAGHWVHADQPAEFVSIVSDFLRKSESKN